MDVVFLVGRILFGVLFVISGLFAHLGEGGKQGREYARSLGAPAPELLVPLSGVTIIAFWLFNQLADPPLTITDALFDRID